MAGISGGYTSQSVPVADVAFNGGLNSTAGPFGVKDNESSELQNIDFNKFGSILKRNGFTVLNTVHLTGTNVQCDGLHWYEFDNTGTNTRHLINVTDGYIYKMDDLDGTWDEIGAATFTANNHVDFENFINRVFMTNGQDIPYQWIGNGNVSKAGTPTNLTTVKYVKEFNNYLIYANVDISSVTHPSRFYWSNLKNPDTWAATDFIEVSLNDGQGITGIRVLGDRLVVFKERSIYIVFFTGDADIPFILPSGGKTNSPVGCVAPFSIQEVDNGLVFLSYDGIYFFDGFNSFKISDKITSTLEDFDENDFASSVSLVQKGKNRYWLSFFADTSATGNNRIIVWDYFNNAFSLYTGIEPSAMTTTYVSGIEERPYFGAYGGYTHRADTGADDFRSDANNATAISAFYKTNWKPFGDLINVKGIPEITVYHRTDSSTMTLAYSYDFEEADQFTQTFSVSGGGDVWDTMLWDEGTWSGSGGGVVRRDLTGRGRVIRFHLKNEVAGESFRIDGLGQLPHLETKQ